VQVVRAADGAELRTGQQVAHHYARRGRGVQPKFVHLVARDPSARPRP
jgi:hypothetical protein